MPSIEIDSTEVRNTYVPYYLIFVNSIPMASSIYSKNSYGF